MNNKFSFEEIEKNLYKQAHKICKRFPGKYEVNELVNEVWLMGDVQRVKNIKFVAARAYFDMICYIRRKEGRKAMRKGVVNDRPKYLTNMSKKDRYGTEQSFFYWQEDLRENGTKEVDDRDEVEYALSFLPEKLSKILRLYYFEEMSLKEIGKSMGLSECRISVLRKKALQQIIEEEYITTDLRVTDAQKKKNSLDARSYGNRCIEKPVVEVLPEYVSDYEIDNECAFDEDFVLERDWEE